MGSLASLSSGCLFFCACVAYISPRIHLWSRRAAVVWAVNKGLCPWFIQAWTPLSEQRLFLEFPWGEGGQESSLGAEQRGVQQCQPWCHCAGSAAGGGSVREDPVSHRRVLARSPDSKLLRKHSFYSIGLLVLPGNTLSIFQRLVSFGCSYLSSADLPYNSWIKGVVPSIHISGSVCQPVLSGCIVTLLAGATTAVTFGLWQDGSVLRGMKFPCNVTLPCVWATQVSLKEEFPTDAVYPVLLLASGQPDTSMLVKETECWGLVLVVPWTSAGGRWVAESSQNPLFSTCLPYNSLNTEVHQCLVAMGHHLGKENV